MAEARVSLETLCAMRDREKQCMRLAMLPDPVRARSRDYYDAFIELICRRLEEEQGCCDLASVAAPIALAGVGGETE